MSDYDKAIANIEQISKAGFYLTPNGKFRKYYFSRDIKYLKNLNKRYETLFKLFVDMGFCEFCPVHMACNRRYLKCEEMLERFLNEKCKL